MIDGASATPVGSKITTGSGWVREERIASMKRSASAAESGGRDASGRSRRWFAHAPAAKIALEVGSTWSVTRVTVSFIWSQATPSITVSSAGADIALSRSSVPIPAASRSSERRWRRPICSRTGRGGCALGAEVGGPSIHASSSSRVMLRGSLCASIASCSVSVAVCSAGSGGATGTSIRAKMASATCIQVGCAGSAWGMCASIWQKGGSRRSRRRGNQVSLRGYQAT